MPLGPADARSAGLVLARAFHDDPVWVWALPDERRRRRLLPWVFARIVALETRRVHVIAAGGAGVGLWVPPDERPPTRLELWRSGLPLLPLRIGRDAAARMSAFQRASFELLNRVAPFPRWFLSGLAVEPSAQRRGLGSALVEWGTARAAAQGVPAVLLTSNRANLPFYERRGFDVVAESELPRGGPLTWVMRTR